MGTAQTKTKPPKDDDGTVDPKTGEVIPTEKGGVPSEYAGYAADAGAGFEHQGQEDTGVPWMALLQPMSPECSAEGATAKPGMWVNRGTGEVFADGASFIPCLTHHVYREWSSKDPSGSAPVADHEIDSPMILKVRKDQPFGDYTNPDNPDHPLVEVFDVFGISLTAEGAGIPSVVSFSSTHIRSYKDWMLRARSIIIPLPSGQKLTNLPLFSHCYTFRSKRVEKKPHVWWVPAISFADPAGAEKSRLAPNDDLYLQAKALREAINSGAAKAAAPVRMEAGDAPLAKGDTSSEKAPY
jgi:hypothetical protein